MTSMLLLGGAGEMGRAAATALAAAPAVDRLVVTDLDERRAVAVARALGPKATGIALDVTDEPALLAALGDCDLVVNTVGPYFRFGVPILTAAIAAGCHYIDICDDWAPTLEMLDMHEQARAAGVVALVGMGASPGVSNLLAVTAARELDTVETLLTGWSGEDARGSAAKEGESPSAAYVHAMHEISGAIRVLRAGALVDRPALRRIEFSYPGIGPGTGWSFGHPEAVTLHRAFPALRENTNLILGGRLIIGTCRAMRFAVGNRILTPEQGARVASAALSRLPGTPPLRPGATPPLFALATGTKAGEKATAATALAQVPGRDMADNTGIPLAVAALMLAAMEPVPGVHPPETLIDPEAFFAALAPHCIGNPPAAAMVATTRSWADPAENADSLRVSLLTAFLAS